MLFRNLTLFKLPASASATDAESFEQALAQHPLRAIGSLERDTRGFCAPTQQPDAPLLHIVAPYALFTLGGWHRVLPAAVIKSEVNERVEKLEIEGDRRVGRKERKALEEEVVDQLLPRAFIKPSRSQGYIDLRQGWVVIDTASLKAAEDLVSQIRGAVGSFPAVPLGARIEGATISERLTQWATAGSGALPENLQLGEDCVLQEAGGSGAPTIRVRNQAISSDEVQQHLQAGKAVKQLSLTFNDTLTFTLTDELVIRSVKALNQEKPQRGGNAIEALDADFALTTLEVAGLLEALVAWFDIDLSA